MTRQASLSALAQSILGPDEKGNCEADLQRRNNILYLETTSMLKYTSRTPFLSLFLLLGSGLLLLEYEV